VAAAERRLAAASAGIGVAVSGYFPNLSISGTGGYTAPQTTNLFTAPNQVWALGATLAQTVFDAGRTRATVSGARALYDEDLAAYRETVLEAFEDVEDQLAAMHLLEREQGVQDEAIAAARQSLERTLNQYRAGTVNHVNVLNAQAALLVAERAGADLAGRRLQAAVALYKATGGDWRVAPGAPPPARQ
jgi:outer membrane protein TolC